MRATTLFVAASVAAGVAIVGCSSVSPEVGTIGQAIDADVPDAAPQEDATVEGGIPAARVCGAVTTPSKCKDGNEAAIVRGVARFDPKARVMGSAMPALAIFLRHSFVYETGENRLGGRLHALKRVVLEREQLRTGVVPFEIDMCELDVAAWTEENGTFNLVVILDENEAHDIVSARDAYAFQTPKTGELAKLISGIEISCHGVSPCIDVPLDCNDGIGCTSITPIEHVRCQLPSCASDTSFCAGAAPDEPPTPRIVDSRTASTTRP